MNLNLLNFINQNINELQKAIIFKRNNIIFFDHLELLNLLKKLYEKKEINFFKKNKVNYAVNSYMFAREIIEDIINTYTLNTEKSIYRVITKKSKRSYNSNFDEHYKYLIIKNEIWIILE